jgi:hypothetical protein
MTREERLMTYGDSEKQDPEIGERSGEYTLVCLGDDGPDV